MALFDFFKRKESALPQDVQEMFKKLTLFAFPGGQKQIEDESDQLHALLGGRLSKEESMQVLTRTKAMLVVSEDKGEKRMVPAIINFSEGKLTPHEATLVYQSMTGVTGDLYGGGDGTSNEQAVVINATVSAVGIRAEYDWISQHYGVQDQDWSVEFRAHGTAEDGRSFETYTIKLGDGSTRKVVFDISSFYCRF